MTQVLQHDYGKGKVSLLQIRAAIKAVKGVQKPDAPADDCKPVRVPAPRTASAAKAGRSR